MKITKKRAVDRRESKLTTSICLLLLLFTIMFPMHKLSAKEGDAPLRVGVISLTHAHVHEILSRLNSSDIDVVGIVEDNLDLARRYSKIYNFSMDIVYSSMDEMITAKDPEAVTAYGSIYEHLAIVEKCAPLGIDVMVEKPLAVSVKHAEKMKRLAEDNSIHLITNYETTWYQSNHKAYKMVTDGNIGELRRVVVNDGHMGPAEIGCGDEFLEWLTDPVLNGAGALTDFGCYGANLITWLQQGQRPELVTAITQTIKPDIYPNVDDEATILLKYSNMQGVIEASWNWPISRKDMQVYGKKGYIYADNSRDIRYRLSDKDIEHSETIDGEYIYDNPFAMFKDVVRGELTLPPFDPSSLENNMIVVEILEAAKQSSKRGKSIKLKKRE